MRLPRFGEGDLMPERSRGVGIIPTSSGSASLDQDSTVIIPGMEPTSPSRWRCDPHDSHSATSSFVAECANAGTGSYTSHTFTTTSPSTTGGSSYIEVVVVAVLLLSLLVFVVVAATV